MNLLLDGVDLVGFRGSTDVEVTGVEYDSRRVGPGDLFCCLPGQSDDGHLHAGAAVEAGAVALLAERPLEEGSAPSVPQALVAPGTARRAMATVAATFYGRPAEALLTAAVTGTNGKTTVTHLLAGALEAAGHPCQVIGTLSGARTTPEAPDLQRQLADLRDRSAQAGRRGAACLEVSSHALVQSRVEGIRFDVAAFTNLSHEHLDYHHSMEAYFEAKASLFVPERSRRAVVNVEDDWGRRLYERLVEAGQEAVAVHPSQVPVVELTVGSTRFLWRGQEVRLQLIGMVNVANALVAAEMAHCLGLEPDVVARGLAAVDPVPGRLEVVVEEDPATILVDYAHTPAALEVALEESARLRRRGGRITIVFGCGGERDREKRPRMGQVAASRADVVIVTSDNSRSEDPAAIAAEIVAGIPSEAREGAPGRLLVELDRGAAIRRAVGWARPGDVVLIAGKGHEGYQETGATRRPFDDRRAAREAALGERAG